MEKKEPSIPDGRRTTFQSCSGVGNLAFGATLNYREEHARKSSRGTFCAPLRLGSMKIAGAFFIGIAAGQGILFVG